MTAGLHCQPAFAYSTSPPGVLPHVSCTSVALPELFLSVYVCVCVCVCVYVHTDSDDDDDKEGGQEGAAGKLSKKQRKLLNQMKIAELKKVSVCVCVCVCVRATYFSVTFGSFCASTGCVRHPAQDGCPASPAACRARVMSF